VDEGKEVVSLKEVCCWRGCGRDVIPKNSLDRGICPICQAEIDAGRVVLRGTMLVDLPDEIRRYDKIGKVRIAYYRYKGRPRHSDPNDSPEVTWEDFRNYLLLHSDFNLHWSVLVWRKPNELTGGRTVLACESSYAGTADTVHVRVVL
jgi:hypothetical protein